MDRSYYVIYSRRRHGEADVQFARALRHSDHADIVSRYYGEQFTENAAGTFRVMYVYFVQLRIEALWSQRFSRRPNCRFSTQSRSEGN